MTAPDRRAAGPVLLVALVAALVAACGVRPTGVIGAGDPAVAHEAVPQTTVYLARGDLLVPVRRTAFPGAPQAALYALWERGATPQESAQGLWSPAQGLYGFHVIFHGDDDGMLQMFYWRSDLVTNLVRAQITCSADAQPGVRGVLLEEEGARGRTRPTSCDRFKTYMSH